MAPTGYGYPPMAPPRRRTPAEVHVCAALLYATGAVTLAAGLVVGIASVSTDALASVALPVVDARAAAGVGVAIGVLMVVIGFATLVVARKVQRGRQWARVLVQVLSGLSLAATVAALVGEGQPDALTGFVLPVLCLILLNLPAVRDWFRYGSGPVR